MEYLLLLAAIGIGYYFWRVNQNKNSSDQGQNAQKQQDLRIENMQIGGVFSIRNFGPDMVDLDVSVVGRHIYNEDGFEWIELEGETSGQKIWLNVEIDDELELSVTLRKLSLEDVGVSEEQLHIMRKAKKGKFKFEDATYKFDDAGKAVFYRNGNRQSGEKHRYWDFQSKDGECSISFELWADGSCDVHISQNLNLSQITVFSIDEGT
jgi:hypothetical protein